MTHADSPVERARLPDVSLPSLAGDAPVPLRAHRRGTVLVLVGDALRVEDGAYLRALAAHEEALRGWDGRVLVVVGDRDTGRGSAIAALAVPFPVVVDEAGRVARAAGVEGPALVVVDHWGEVHVGERVPDGAAWMAPEEVEQWLRMIAVRCAG